MTSSDACDFRRLLKAAVERELVGEPVALLFSAGTDSLTVLWTLLELNARVTCYTFRLKALQSTDAKASALACRTWNVPQVIVTDGPDVEGDVRRVVGIIGSARKTHVEVMYAYWHLLAAVKERQVWSGIQADTLYGSNKKSAIAHGKTSAAKFAAFRRSLLTDADQEGLAQAHLLAKHFSKDLRTPYSDAALREWFMAWNWSELNRPRQKMPAVLGFRDRFSEVAIYRKDDNLQCGSGIREHMERTFGGRQRAAYKRILAEVTSG